MGLGMHVFGITIALIDTDLQTQLIIDFTEILTSAVLPLSNAHV